MRAWVQRGHRYRAKIVVGFWKRPFANPMVIAEKLRNAGFEKVQVWARPEAGEYEAEASWPRSSPDQGADVDEIQEYSDLG